MISDHFSSRHLNWQRRERPYRLIPPSFVSSGLTEDKLNLMLKSHGLILRDEFPAFCDAIKESGIPLIISTAGLADVVEGALRGWNHYTGTAWTHVDSRRSTTGSLLEALSVRLLVGWSVDWLVGNAFVKLVKNRFFG